MKERMNEKKGVRKTDQEPAFSRKSLNEFRKEQYAFCISDLGFTPKKAREWVARTIDVIREVEQEFQGIH